MSRPKISVVLLSYNHAPYLAASVQSVLDQSIGDWELIVVDNGSTDESQKILSRFGGHPNVRLEMFKENQAPNKRLNAAVALSTGQYISILYSDDFYLPQKLEIQARLLDGEGAQTGVAHSPGFRLNDSTGEQWTDPFFPCNGWVLESLLDQIGRGPLINPISPLIRRECLTSHPFNEAIFMEGESHYLRLALTHRFVFDPEPTVVMRDHGNNLGRSVKRNYIHFFEMLELLGRDAKFPASQSSRLAAAFARSYRGAGWQGVRVINDAKWGRQMLLKAVSADWKQSIHPRVAIGLGASLLPNKFRTIMQRTLNRLRPQKGFGNFVNRDR
jgi:glycosyltransferase involved in cell wall biosynthesis